VLCKQDVRLLEFNGLCLVVLRGHSGLFFVDRCIMKRLVEKKEERVEAHHDRRDAGEEEGAEAAEGQSTKAQPVARRVTRSSARKRL